MAARADDTVTVEQALTHGARLLPLDAAAARAQAEEILRVHPSQPEALRLLAKSCLALDDAQRAVALLAAVAGMLPRSSRAHLELGEALGRAGRGDAAIRALQRAIALQPDQPGAWLALGDHLAASGDEVGAEHAYAQHLRFAASDPGLLAAGAALAEGRLDEAEARLRARLSDAPSDVAALRMLAEVAARLGRHEDGELLLERCLELAPDFHAARQNYALVLYRGNQPARALAEIERLLAHDPYHPSWRNLKAVVLGRIGDYDAALGRFAALLAEYPNNARLWLSQGHTLKTAGRREEAIEAYRRAIALQPSFGEAYWSLANLKTVRFEDSDVAAMRAQLAAPDLAPADRWHFEFTLGKALEDRAAWEASFRHYAEGNRLRRAAVPHSAQAITMRVRRAKKVFTREFFDARRGWGCPADDPIFVVGLPRSGSTLVEQILSSHPQVEGTMELPEVISMTRMLRRQSGRGEQHTYYDALAELGADEVRALGESYIERTRILRRSGAPRFVDKMPNNFMHLALIHLALPNARIVDARRHPMACGFSCFKQHFARGQNFTYSQEDLGRYWRDYADLMAHFDAVLPGRVHRVVYERMVVDTDGEVRALLDHLGLPFDARCLRFFENDRPVRTASSEQVRRPIYREGVDHWRHYENWLGPLRQALGAAIDTYPEAPAADPADARATAT
ncbi:MAG: tetratricopeptide repeat-containing sulfotransferase family protein [Pseudomonadota bacterium]